MSHISHPGDVCGWTRGPELVPSSKYDEYHPRTITTIISSKYMQQLQELVVCLVGTFQLVTFLFTFLVAMPSFILHIAKENGPVFHRWLTGSPLVSAISITNCWSVPEGKCKFMQVPKSHLGY